MGLNTPPWRPRITRAGPTRGTSAGETYCACACAFSRRGAIAIRRCRFHLEAVEEDEGLEHFPQVRRAHQARDRPVAAAARALRDRSLDVLEDDSFFRGVHDGVHRGALYAPPPE